MRPIAFLSLALTLILWAQTANGQVRYFPGTGWKTFSFAWPQTLPTPRPTEYTNREGTFTFTVHPGQQAVLTIVDVGFPCESFQVLNSGSYVGTTRSPTDFGLSAPAFRSLSNPNSSLPWSSGAWPLTPGTYALSFNLAQWHVHLRDVFHDPPDSLVAVFRVDVVNTPDADNDGLADQFETGTGIYVSPVDTGTSPSNPDSDGDGLGDWEEIATHETNPNLEDTDGDGFNDDKEIAAGSSPTDATLTPAPLVRVIIDESEDMSAWTPIATRTVPAASGGKFFRARITREGVSD